MPGPEMRAAMAAAELGDDVFGEDPEINRLQESAAERFGKEAAIFVASGTMGNLIGLLVNARAGQEVISDAEAHIFLYEAGGAAMVGGIQMMPIRTEAGIMHPDQIRAAIRPDDQHHPPTAAVSFENTHNRHGGIAWPLADLRAAADEARRHGLAVHIDGARIFNAAIATGSDVRDIAACADTLTFCLSKGLGAPVGSLLVGPEDKIHDARRWRKMLGGGMREIGMLGAAGQFALDRMVDRLADDHTNARTLAEGLAEMQGVKLDLQRVQTNLVIFELEELDPRQFLAECQRRGLKGGTMGPRRVRFVTHYGIEPEDIQHALKVVDEVLAGA